MKKRSKHVIPLTKQMIDILVQLKPLTGNRAHLFPNRNDPRKPMSSQFVKRMGYHKKLVVHGLRSLASITLNEQGFNRDVIEASLAHGDRNFIRGTYNRTSYQCIKLMAWWSAHIEQASQGDLSLTGAKGFTSSYIK